MADRIGVVTQSDLTNFQHEYMQPGEWLILAANRRQSAQGKENRMPDQTEEQFEIFSESGERLGLKPRSYVHAHGLWHKSAHVFLFNSAGEFYLQLRAPDKDLYAGLWDYSVGEHLTPGESYLQAALRGLAEELGVTGMALEPLGEVQQSRGELPEIGARDYELQQAFTGVWDGPIEIDPIEVSQVRTVVLAELDHWIHARPHDFTPWLLRDLENYRILGK